MKKSTPKVAIVHDWLVGGGAERVVLELHRIFPDAPIYTSYCSPEWRKRLDDKVVTGYLQRWPFSRLRKFLPVLRIWWFGSLKFDGYDLVISSTGNGEAKGIKVPKGTLHVCYCHSPTHFYWRHYNQYLENPGYGTPLLNAIARTGLKLLAGPLRSWDLRASRRPDIYIANSSHIQADIKKYYGRDSIVIHPPIDTERFGKVPLGERSGFVTMGRLAAYKRVDIVIEACNRLQLPLKVIGRGPELENLKKLAGPTVTFLTDVSDEDMPKHLAGAEAFLFAAFEDFGVAPVEAMAAGTPVIAYQAGGALDYVVDGKTGLFFTPQTTDALEATLKDSLMRDFDHAAIRDHAEQFKAANFQDKLKALLSKALNN